MLTDNETRLIERAMETIAHAIEYAERVDELPAQAPKLRRECCLMLRDLHEVLGEITAAHNGLDTVSPLAAPRMTLRVCEEPGESSTQISDLGA